MKPMVNINVNQGYDSSSRDYGNPVAYNASINVQFKCKYVVNEEYNHLNFLYSQFRNVRAINPLPFKFSF